MAPRGTSPGIQQEVIDMGKKPRLSLLLLAAASLCAVTVDYALTELSSKSKVKIG